MQLQLSNAEQKERETEMNISEIQNKLTEAQNVRNTATEAKILRLQQLAGMHAVKAQQLQAKLPALVEVLAKHHLEICSLTTYKTGMDDSQWAENDKLRVDISAKPTSDKFKFIQFAGYTARGSGKNQERLEARATKLADATSATIGVSAQVNCYSFELKEPTSTKNILITLWL